MGTVHTEPLSLLFQKLEGDEAHVGDCLFPLYDISDISLGVAVGCRAAAVHLGSSRDFAILGSISHLAVQLLLRRSLDLTLCIAICNLAVRFRLSRPFDLPFGVAICHFAVCRLLGAAADLALRISVDDLGTFRLSRPLYVPLGVTERLFGHNR